MQVTDQVVWDGTDFAILGALLVGVGVTFELAARKTGNSAYRSAVVIIGAIIARFQPRGMARAMFATGVAQALVAVIALIAGFGSADPNWPLDILMATGFFAALWLISAWLFQKAAREPARN